MTTLILLTRALQNTDETINILWFMFLIIFSLIILAVTITQMVKWYKKGKCNEEEVQASIAQALQNSKNLKEEYFGGEQLKTLKRHT